MPDAESLFALHHDRILRYLSRTIGQTDDARDLTQDVFLRVTKTPPPARDSMALRAWLFHIARNVAIDYLRRRERRQPPGTTIGLAAGYVFTQDVWAAGQRKRWRCSPRSTAMCS